MIRLGKTYGDLMVDVRSSNEKLAARARRVVRLATGVSDDEAERALAEADGSAKVAVVALLAGVDADDGARAARAGLGRTSRRRSSDEARRRSRARRRGARPGRRRGRRRRRSRPTASPARNGRGCIAVPGFVDLQVNGFGGVDFMGADADGYAPRRRGAARDRRHRVPADLHLRARGGPARGARQRAARPARPAPARRPPRGAVPLGQAPRRPPARGAARPRPGAARAPARRRAGAADDARARAARAPTS